MDHAPSGAWRAPSDEEGPVWKELRVERLAGESQIRDKGAAVPAGVLPLMLRQEGPGQTEPILDDPEHIAIL